MAVLLDLHPNRKAGRRVGDRSLSRQQREALQVPVARTVAAKDTPDRLRRSGPGLPRRCRRRSGRGTPAFQPRHLGPQAQDQRLGKPVKPG